MPKCIGDLGTVPCPDVRVDQTLTDWTFNLGDDGAVAWDWSTGDPPYRLLAPVRNPRSTAKSWHAPVTTQSYTTGTWLRLESGLELDLVRALDRLPEVEWIVPQPVRLRFQRGADRVVHTPDVLTLHDGVVTVWDVRAADGQDDDFLLKRSLTADACEHVGWHYRVFAGHSSTTRLNLLWLHNYRRPQSWYPMAADQLRHLIGDGASIGDVLTADNHSGYLISTMWHLIWSGEIACNLDRQFTRESKLGLRAA